MMSTCPICSKEMNLHLANWCFKCPHCQFLMSNLVPAINHKDTMDETRREQGIKLLRQRNFLTILKELSLLIPPSKDFTLLEVGSAHGWFLQLARQWGYQTLGVEPSEKQTPPSSSIGTIRRGLFPSVLLTNESFRVIVFNDVFEHIPNPQNVIKSCKAHLENQGYLVVNLPSSHGFFYKMATFLAYLSWKHPFERLWQKDFESPHISYFSPKNLDYFLQKNGFVKVKTISLYSLRIEGLWARLSTDKQSPTLMNIIYFPLLLLIIPLLRIFPNDIYCAIYQKQAADNVLLKDL